MPGHHLFTSFRASRLGPVVGVLAIAGLAQAAPGQHLDLRVRTIDTSEARTDIAGAVRGDRDHGMAGCWRLIQLDGPMTPERRRRLMSAGVRIAQYLPPNAFLIRGEGADCDLLEGIDFIRWTAPYDAAWKVDGALRDEDADEAAVTITLHQGEDAATIFDAFNTIPGAVAFDAQDVGGNQTISAIIPRASLDQLAALNGVQFIEPNAEPTLRNGSGEWINQSNIPSDYAIWDHGLTGAGQIVGVIDGNIDPDHCSFADTEPFGPTNRKILAYNTNVINPDKHGTHVAGIVAGNDLGPDGDNLKGNAYDAKIVYNSTPSLDEASVIGKFQLHHDQGARVHTNSWGWDHTNAYSAASRAVDVFSHDNEDDLVVFAVSNGTTVKIPENAKNCLAVAATLDDSFQDFWCFGGAGPTIDGRRKPEIMAPGCGILSAKWNTACDVQSLSGTSMATPAISAMALLTRQWFMEGYYPSGVPSAGDAMTPSAALLKAMLINSAIDMSGEPGYPSAREGWGRVLLDNALCFTGEALRTVVRDVRNADSGAMTTGQMAEHHAQVTDSGMPLRITMVFNDAPATVGAAFAPVNDLDLEVISPSGVIYKGNDFAGGVSTTGGPFDAINTVEQVHVTTPETGLWTVRVLATAVNMGSQGYALVITGAVLDGDLAPACPADINNDGIIDTADLGQLLMHYGSGAGSPADLNSDGVVDTADLGILLQSFGQPCP
ncbi:MAG: S8 family serine peptidase [Phycisphaeraceae bacterium]|nr:S8 family serine peptidase [Phycisphaeraceae bacterium]